jgi:predicted deacetylase
LRRKKSAALVKQCGVGWGKGQRKRAFSAAEAIMATRYLIRFDDITPRMAWSNFVPFEAVANHYSLPFLIGVVPDNRDPALNVDSERDDFWQWLRAKRAEGWTIAQHGHTHLYATDQSGLLGIGKKSEFAGLSFDVQYQKLAEGKAILARENLWQGVFMAPSHAFDQTTLAALKALEFEAITDGYGFYPSMMGGMIAVPQLLSRPLGLGFGVETVCLHVNTMSEQAIARMVAWLSSHHDKIISFSEAMAMRASVPGFAPFMSAASRFALRTLRAVRA